MKFVGRPRAEYAKFNHRHMKNNPRVSQVGRKKKNEKATFTNRKIRQSVARKELQKSTFSRSKKSRNSPIDRRKKLKNSSAGCFKIVQISSIGHGKNRQNRLSIVRKKSRNSSVGCRIKPIVSGKYSKIPLTKNDSTQTNSKQFL